MKHTVLAAALVALTSVAALATDIADTDANGTFSIEELKAAFPDLTDDAFKAADTDADGQLSADELKAAQEAGTIPA
ncbi:EF-hand domain-containing protein [Rhodobacter sp. KR11]|uniref:EF-hand domain-containing protein n=1 Tax=Rhodobacter sp. KR11 TaxID=2974588 RepID=UPI0022222963|nr:EF-hand domain-containing protein [Rhodobacter sp. KR11]MCW1920611.1 EF-hand domain-containing protein [Rhodobacter sp. KR11]